MKPNQSTQRIINVIKKVVCGYYDLKVKQLNSKTKKSKIVIPRQIAMYFCILIIGKRKISLAEIGYQIGRKDHATVLHAIKKVISFIETDREYRNQIVKIEALIKKALTPGNEVKQEHTEKPTETSINDGEQYKVLTDGLQIKIKTLQQRNNLYQKIIKELNFKLRIAEGQIRLYKKVQSYHNIPANILQGG